MSIYQDRIHRPMMAYYREVYKDSKRWDNKEDPNNLKNKRVIIYGEQGFGDQIQFLRFIPLLKETGCHIIMQSPEKLHRIIKTYGVDVFAEVEKLPEHDFHILSLDLPFVLRKPIPLDPYIIIPEKTETLPGFNIGIAWEGNPLHENNKNRSCPLKYFKALQREGVNLFCLQPSINEPSLVEGAEDLDLNGVEIDDFYDTAMLLNSLNMVVCVDTGVMHLAGAMGKDGYGLLHPATEDPRWKVLWYPTIKMLRGNWQGMFDFLIKDSMLMDDQEIHQRTTRTDC